MLRTNSAQETFGGKAASPCGWHPGCLGRGVMDWWHAGMGAQFPIDSRSGRSLHYASPSVPGAALGGASRSGGFMAFVRRKGNSFYLVHNVRQQGKVKQLHLARLGEKPRITDDVVRDVTRKHPFLDLDWSRLREQVNSRVELFDWNSDYARKLVQSIRELNLDLAELAPAVLGATSSPATRREIITLLRLLRSTVDIKLNQFELGRDIELLARRRYS